MERILTAYTEGPAMNDSPDFQRAVAGQPSDVMLRFHLNVGGILDQVNHNAVQIARNVASLPEWLKEPEYPEYPDEMADEDDYAAWEKAMDRYYEESSQFYEKAREWRIEHAEENSERVREIVNSCRVFGDGCMWMSRIEDTVMESGVVYRLNMDALPRGE